MASIFTKIIQGEIPCYKIAENEHYLAFLDINPLREGHTLVVPKLEVDYIFDLESPAYTELWEFAKEVAHKIKTVVPCNRVGIAVVGLEVPHAHIHLIPIDTIADMDFGQPKLELSAERLETIAQQISTTNTVP
jgi:histidine triad (HIT) family protein